MFATADELMTYLRRSFTPDEVLAAELYIEIATETIRSAAGQHISLVEDDAVELAGTLGPDLWLPQRPVVSVASIAVDGAPLAATEYRWRSNGRVTLGSACSAIVNASARASAGYWGGPLSTVAVVYSHGYDPDPADVRGVCLALAARAMSAPDAGAITQESLGSYSVSYASASASTLTDDEERKLRHRYGRRQATVPAVW